MIMGELASGAIWRGIRSHPIANEDAEKLAAAMTKRQAFGLLVERTWRARK
jgi:hypothetical protein